MARKSKDKLIDALSDYKSAREAMIHADEQEFMHHLRVFLKELEGNYLCKEIVSSLPEFDVNAWWQTETQGVDGYSMHLESLDFPDDKDERLVALLELARTIGSDNRDEISLYKFGRLFGLFKNEEALNIAKSIVFRPLADDLTRRLRKAASLANPEIRDLTGVPHARIPANSETAIFLSHKSANKDLIRRYHAVLKELGYDPWLDEEAIVAGQTLHRALASGMDRSCAAVFFITPDFKDESWLK